MLKIILVTEAVHLETTERVLSPLQTGFLNRSSPGLPLAAHWGLAFLNTFPGSLHCDFIRLPNRGCRFPFISQISTRSHYTSSMAKSFLLLSLFASARPVGPALGCGCLVKRVKCPSGFPGFRPSSSAAPEDVT